MKALSDPTGPLMADLRTYQTCFFFKFKLFELIVRSHVMWDVV